MGIGNSAGGSLEMESFFASPERSAAAALVDEIHFASHNSVIEALLENVHGMLAVLNEHRQILAVNSSLAAGLGIDDPGEVLGLRPGETLGCVRAREMPGGCGTGRSCSTCGAAVAIVASQDSRQPVSRTCAIEVRKNGDKSDLFLQVWARPIELDGRQFVLLFIQDITEDQRRTALEHVFLHDLNNLATGILGTAELMDVADPEQDTMIRRMRRMARRLAREMELQRAMVDGELLGAATNREEFDVAVLLKEIGGAYRDHPAARRVTLCLPQVPVGLTLRSDRSLLLRILGNMTLNALEATGPGGEVRLAVESGPDLTRFLVWNPGFVPEAVARRIFQLNFSTKPGAGRGLGTYAMRRFARESLGGEVDFRSTPQDGTTFWLDLPG